LEECFVPKLGKLLLRNPESPDPQILNWFFAQGMTASHYATVESQKSLRDEDLRNDMQMISDRNLPVAIFHEKVCPFDLAEVLNKGIEGSKLVKFHESGHALNIEEKEKTNEELMKFITA